MGDLLDPLRQPSIRPFSRDSHRVSWERLGHRVLVPGKCLAIRHECRNVSFGGRERASCLSLIMMLRWWGRGTGTGSAEPRRRELHIMDAKPVLGGILNWLCIKHEASLGMCLVFIHHATSSSIFVIYILPVMSVRVEGDQRLVSNVIAVFGTPSAVLTSGPLRGWCLSCGLPAGRGPLKIRHTHGLHWLLRV